MGKYKIVVPKGITPRNRGFFYMIRIGDYIKIGRTMNLKSRLSYYNSFPPFEYELLVSGEIGDCHYAERYIQNHFIKYQVKGEWFKIPETWDNPKEKAEKIFNIINGLITDVIERNTKDESR